MGGRTRGIADVARVDKDTDHHRNLLLGNQIVDHVERRIIAVAIDVAAAILEDHERGGSLGIVLRGDVDPVFAPHAVINLAGVRDGLGERAGRNSRLQIGKGPEGGQIEPAAELSALHQIVEGMELPYPVDARRDVPKIGAGQIAHSQRRGIVDDQHGASRGFGREEEIGAVAGPGGAVFQILSFEARGDGIAQGGAIGFGERNELRRG